MCPLKMASGRHWAHISSPSDQPELSLPILHVSLGEESADTEELIRVRDAKRSSASDVSSLRPHDLGLNTELNQQGHGARVTSVINHLHQWSHDSCPLEIGCPPHCAPSLSQDCAAVCRGASYAGSQDAGCSAYSVSPCWGRICPGAWPKGTWPVAIWLPHSWA